MQITQIPAKKGWHGSVLSGLLFHFVLFYFMAGSPVSQVSLELDMKLGMTLNF